MPKQGPRKKIPATLAVIHADQCTGCEACIEVCPVDCIEVRTVGGGLAQGGVQWCEIDVERCVGCELCIRLPRKKSDPYELKVCPWDAIEMTPTEQVAEAVARMGGPPEYVAVHWDRLVDSALAIAQLRLDAK